MGRRRLSVIAALAVLIAAPASAAEIARYIYDALGRVVVADARSSSAGGHLAVYSLDAASNRTSYQSYVQKRVSTFTSGMSLSKGETIVSSNLSYMFTLQTDGNLVLYAGLNQPLWATMRFGGGMHLDMQGDGNLVLYQGPQPVCHTGTHGHPGAYLVVQDDGNLAVFGDAGQLLWSKAQSNGYFL